VDIPGLFKIVASRKDIETPFVINDKVKPFFRFMVNVFATLLS
jgi:hypothetical protein